MSKYKVGDVVYVIRNNKVMTGNVMKIYPETNEYFGYIFDKDDNQFQVILKEKEIYPTPESIIKHLLPTP